MGKMMKDLHYRIWGLHVVLGQNIQVPALRRQMATEEGKEKLLSEYVYPLVILIT